ncbi:hypothetical protein LTR95_018637, partial [Oleoguttula sp. CCFEE 5521]
VHRPHLRHVGRPRSSIRPDQSRGEGEGQDYATERRQPAEEVPNGPGRDQEHEAMV